MKSYPQVPCPVTQRPLIQPPYMGAVESLGPALGDVKCVHRAVENEVTGLVGLVEILA